MQGSGMMDPMAQEIVAHMEDFLAGMRIPASS